MKEDNEQRTIKTDNDNLLSLALSILDVATSSSDAQSSTGWKLVEDVHPTPQLHSILSIVSNFLSIAIANSLVVSPPPRQRTLFVQ